LPEKGEKKKETEGGEVGVTRVQLVGLTLAMVVSCSRKKRGKKKGKKSSAGSSARLLLLQYESVWIFDDDSSWIRRGMATTASSRRR